MPDLDRLDRLLLELLQDDARLPLAELGKRADAPASTVGDRIKRLFARGLITGFHAHLAPEELGLKLLAFILVRWDSAVVENEFLRRIKASPLALECHHVTGAWNYLLKLRIEGPRDLERFLAKTLGPIGGLDHTETIIVLSSAKETWQLPVHNA